MFGTIVWLNGIASDDPMQWNSLILWWSITAPIETCSYLISGPLVMSKLYYDHFGHSLGFRLIFNKKSTDRISNANFIFFVPEHFRNKRFKLARSRFLIAKNFTIFKSVTSAWWARNMLQVSDSWYLNFLGHIWKKVSKFCAWNGAILSKSIGLNMEMHI